MIKRTKYPGIIEIRYDGKLTAVPVYQVGNRLQASYNGRKFSGSNPDDLTTAVLRDAIADHPTAQGSFKTVKG